MECVQCAAQGEPLSFAVRRPATAVPPVPQVASQVGALDVGYKAGVGDLSGVRLLYLLGAVGVGGRGRGRGRQAHTHTHTIWLTLLCRTLEQ